MAALTQQQEGRTTTADSIDEENDNPFKDFVIIDRNYENKEFPFCKTLMDSGSFSDFEIYFYSNKTQETIRHEYSVWIAGIPENFPPAAGRKKKFAKNAAAEKALKVLSRHCYTVKYKAHKEVITNDILLSKATVPIPVITIEDPVAEEVSCGSVPGEMSGIVPQEDIVRMDVGCDSSVQTHMVSSSSIVQADAVCDRSVQTQTFSSSPIVRVDAGYDNLQTQTFSSTQRNLSTVSACPDTIASKMLKMMGWDGGGLGKDGSGIIEPIKSSLVLGRFGLGHSKRKISEVTPEAIMKEYLNKELRKNELKKQKMMSDNLFISGVHAIIENFIEKSQDQELIFSSKFSSLHRKIIHDVASEYNLSSISFGRQKSRHLVLFREHNTHDFLQNLSDRAQKDTDTNYQIIPPSENHPLHFS